MVVFHLRPTIYSWETMLIVGSRAWRLYASCLPTRLNSRRTFSS
ncbi:unnamed protein product [Linum tenue]|uniref:Uncharacterized protein n=1 Tax=Linum tenue TaxID=586396 RepID=A0AAV0NU24_9ROSI|nr:unnamed protein product [Linum tenue]